MAKLCSLFQIMQGFFIIMRDIFIPAIGINHAEVKERFGIAMPRCRLEKLHDFLNMLLIIWLVGKEIRLVHARLVAVLGDSLREPVIRFLKILFNAVCPFCIQQSQAVLSCSRAAQSRCTHEFQAFCLLLRLIALEQDITEPCLCIQAALARCQSEPFQGFFKLQRYS